MTSIKTPTRVGAYVDGYNLFYGRLRGTAFKWLDIVGLVDDLLAERDQNESLIKLNLFTAHALARFASHGAASVEAQTTYLRAMATRHGERSLSETADWSLMTLSDDQLASAQLPALVPTRKKPLRKPAHW